MSSIPSTHLDLIGTGVPGAFVTLNNDGTPQATAVSCFIDDDGDLKVSMNSTRQKLKNLRARPACTLLVIDRENQGRTLEVRARARIVHDEDRSIVKRLLATLGVGGDASEIDGPGVERYAAVLEIVKVRVTG